MEDPVVLRPLGPSKVGSFASLVDEHPLFARYGLTPDRVAASLAAADGQGQVVLGATRDGRPLGFAWFDPTGALGGGGGYLRLLVVADAAVGGGVGGRLMDAVEARVFARSRHLFLLVQTENSRARAFYRRRGYRRVGRIPSFAASGIDEDLLHKPRPADPA